MARNNQTEHPLDIYLRGIVRDEFARMFSGISANNETEVDPTFNTPTSLNAGGSGSTTGTTRTGRGRRAKKIKGRPTNPATDRRFKKNRELNN